MLQVVLERSGSTLIAVSSRLVQRNCFFGTTERYHRESGNRQGQGQQQADRWQDGFHHVRLLVAKGLDWIHHRSSTSRVDAEDDANANRNAKCQSHRPPLHYRFDIREAADDPWN